VTPGVYRVAPVVTASERAAGLTFVPDAADSTVVARPVMDVAFSQVSHAPSFLRRVSLGAHHRAGRCYTPSAARCTPPAHWTWPQSEPPCGRHLRSMPLRRGAVQSQSSEAESNFQNCDSLSPSCEPTSFTNTC
jgi:hypothetical protein